MGQLCLSQRDGNVYQIQCGFRPGFTQSPFADPDPGLLQNPDPDPDPVFGEQKIKFDRCKKS